MKQLIIALVLVLVGCSSIDPGEYKPVVEHVQAYSIEKCRFKPSQDTVLSMIEAYRLNLEAAQHSVAPIGDYICSAVTSDKRSLNPFGWTLYIHGEEIYVTGSFVETN